MTCSGTRAAELALRMKYAGVEPARLHVVERARGGARRRARRGDGPLYALPTYTALLEHIGPDGASRLQKEYAARRDAGIDTASLKGVALSRALGGVTSK